MNQSVLDEALARVIARDEIRNLVSRFAHAVDTGDIATVVNSFTKDGEFESGPGQVSIGRAEIQNLVTEKFHEKKAILEQQKHLIAHHSVDTHYIDCVSRTEASGRVYWTYIHHDTGLSMWGRFVDEYVYEDGVWLLKKRQSIYDGAAPESDHYSYLNK